MISIISGQSLKFNANSLYKIVNNLLPHQKNEI